MLVGLLGLGMVFGMVAGGMALAAGGSLLYALGLYAAVGAGSVVLLVPALMVVGFLRDLMFARPGFPE